MSDQQLKEHIRGLRQEQKRYNDLQNEGGEGYNPYDEKIRGAEFEQARRGGYAPETREHHWAYSDEAVKRALMGADSADDDGSDDPANYADDMADAYAGAAGILYLSDSGRVLLIRRGDDTPDHPGTWAFPAGHIEEGETPLQAARRESKEETGHEPEADPNPLQESNGFALFVSREHDFPPVLNDESTGYVWAKPDDLPAPLHPGVQEAVALALTPEQAADGTHAMDESARVEDVNRYITIRDNPLSKVGVYPYKGRQIPGAPDPDQTYWVYRPEEELSAPETVDSFKLIPWIDNHAMLGPQEAGLTPAEQKGVEGVIGEDVRFDGGTLYGNLKVFSQSLADLIEAGKRELSCGYRCKYEAASGTFDGKRYDYIQRQIRGNHIALVESGRMGPEVAVLDGYALDQSTFTFDEKDIEMADENNTPDAGAGGGLPAQLTLAEVIKIVAELKQAISALQGTARPAGDADPDGAGDDPNAGGGSPPDGAQSAGGGNPPVPAKDAEAEPPVKPDDKPTPEKKDGAAMDAAIKPLTFKDFAAQTAARDRLYARLSEHTGAFDHYAMDATDVARYGVKKLGIQCASGQEMAVLEGYLHNRPSPRKQPVFTVKPGGGAVGMDSANADFLTTYLNGGK
jgi:8-oxo-dGTP pyrophosphatase MutT (NUDIX family)